MSTENFTSETGFILLGLTSQQNQLIVLFVVFLTMFLLTVLGNLLIIILVHIDAQLHTPMYFFLCHLASLDIVYVTSSLPQTLVHLLAGNGVLSLTSCMLQGYSGLLTGSTECLLLGVMAYDRYFAICNPLRYVSAMNRKHQHLLATSCWIIGGVFSMVNVIASFGIFCGPNHINHFMCELRFLIALACDDIKLTKVILNSLSAFMILIPLSVILCSYSCILYVGFQMQSIMGCYKVLSTCGSHLVLVTLFYGTIISIYITPHSSSSPDKNKKIAILYLVVTPLFNPIIYTFRNKDVHRAVIKVLNRRNFKGKP